MHIIYIPGWRKKYKCNTILFSNNDKKNKTIFEGFNIGIFKDISRKIKIKQY